MWEGALHCSPPYSQVSTQGQLTQQSEEWEEGMPPAATRCLMSQKPFLYLSVKICRERRGRRREGWLLPPNIRCLTPIRQGLWCWGRGGAALPLQSSHLPNLRREECHEPRHEDPVALQITEAAGAAWHKGSHGESAARAPTGR